MYKSIWVAISYVFLVWREKSQNIHYRGHDELAWIVRSRTRSPGERFQEEAAEAELKRDLQQIALLWNPHGKVWPSPKASLPFTSAPDPVQLNQWGCQGKVPMSGTLHPEYAHLHPSREHQQRGSSGCSTTFWFTVSECYQERIGEKELSTHHHMGHEIFPKRIKDFLTKLGGFFRGPLKWSQNPENKGEFC